MGLYLLADALGLSHQYSLDASFLFLPLGAENSISSACLSPVSRFIVIHTTNLAPRIHKHTKRMLMNPLVQYTGPIVLE